MTRARAYSLMAQSSILAAMGPLPLRKPRCRTSLSFAFEVFAAFILGAVLASLTIGLAILSIGH